jgi:hypothetical protein
LSIVSGIYRRLRKSLRKEYPVEGPVEEMMKILRTLTMNIEDIDRRLCQIEMKVDSMLRD